MNSTPTVTLYAGFSGEHMDRLHDELRGHLSRAGIDGPSAYVLQTVADEMVCNILEHSSALWIELEIHPVGEKVALMIRDNGEPFDPLPAMRANTPQQQALRSDPRNLGLYMAGQLGKEWVYRRLQGGVNQVSALVELTPEEGIRWTEHAGVRLLVLVSDPPGGTEMEAVGPKGGAS